VTYAEASVVWPPAELAESLHPSTLAVLEYFVYGHLPEPKDCAVRAAL